MTSAFNMRMQPEDTAWPIVSGSLGGLAGLGTALSLSNAFVQGLAGASVATVVTMAMLALTCRSDLLDVVHTLTGTMRDASRVGLARGESA